MDTLPKFLREKQPHVTSCGAGPSMHGLYVTSCGAWPSESFDSVFAWNVLPRNSAALQLVRWTSREPSGIAMGRVFGARAASRSALLMGASLPLGGGKWEEISIIGVCVCQRLFLRLSHIAS